MSTTVEQERETEVAKSPVPTDRSRVLLVEDNKILREQLQTLLSTDVDFDIELASNGKEALEKLAKTRYSVMLTDLRMPGLDGMELLDRIRELSIPVTVILFTGHGSIDQAVQAIRAGAYDFLVKPVDPDHVKLVINRALRERAMQDEVAFLREELAKRYSVRNIITKSPRLHAVFELIDNIAHSTSTVLIEGETGTGKELLAKAIHQASSRHRNGPLIALNYAAIPELLLESELFGHEKGSFTGAVAQRVGRFEQANGGTLFLDEIGEVPASIQAKLLRVLQERCFERVGGTASICVDVRVIAATNRSLERLVRKRRFREDLFYRLNVVRISLPPLRERPEDIPLLAAHFIEKYSNPDFERRSISPQAMEALLNYSWPGNVRELENAIERACVTSRAGAIELEHLALDRSRPGGEQRRFPVDLSKTLPELLHEASLEIERQYLARALKKTRGNVSQCAKLAGLSRRSVTSKIAEHKIDRIQYKEDH